MKKISHMMKKPTLFLLFCLVASVLSKSKAMAEEKWTIVKEKNGILIEAQEVSDSPLKRFRGTALVKAPLGRILGFFNDTNEQAKLMPNVTERILEEIKSGDMYIYQRVANRMASDRDVILHIQVKTVVEEKAVYLTFTSVERTPTPEKNQPEIPGVIRMPFIRGHWKLKPIEQGQWTEVEYDVHSNPGGSIPNWIANWVAKNLPYDTISTLQKQVSSRQYPEFENGIEQHPDYKLILAP